MRRKLQNKQPAPMARPKKPRIVDGVTLPDNLYPDPKKRPGYWRYVREDGTQKIFQAGTAEAVRLSIEANALRGAAIPHTPKLPARDAVLTHVNRYITWRQVNDPKLKNKSSWQNRCSQLRAFAADFSHTRISQLTFAILRTWWEKLSYHAQHNRRAEFNKLFNYFGAEALTPRLQSNPFTTDDSQTRLLKKGKPSKKRVRLSLGDFWTIYNKAGEMHYTHVQIAMAISLITTMREGDICALRFDEHVTKTSLRKTINKSEAQREEISVAHLEFAFARHPMLKKQVDRARELSLQHCRCPFLISFNPKQRRTGKTKAHTHQVTPDRLIKHFAEVRDACELYPPVSDTYSPPTFHEVRALASNRFDAAGFDINQVQELMAHTDPRVTRTYQAGHGVVYTEIEIALPMECLGGEF